MLFFLTLFQFLYDLMQVLQHLKSIYYHFYWWHLLLLFCFMLMNQENLYIIHHDLHFIYDILNMFLINLISIKQWYKKSFDDFICIIINHEPYVITLWMHYTLFISVFGRNEINCYYWLNFPCLIFLEIIYVFQAWFNFMEIFSDW